MYSRRVRGAARAVVVFVHGGGFTMGDKGDATAPFFNNFGAWAVREGFVGVTLTYRLAPDHVWPSGAVDLERAVAWITANIAQYGGDPRRIVLAGQSAGATHVASYLAGQGRPVVGPPTWLQRRLFSGVFDLAIADRNGPTAAYYGADASLYAERSTVKALGSTAVPCLFTVSELDPAQFHRQAAAVVNARLAGTGRTPELLWLAGHNHVSSVMQLGSGVDTLGPSLAGFVRRVAERVA